MSRCHKPYPGKDFLPVVCTKQEHADGRHMNIDKLFSWHECICSDPARIDAACAVHGA